VLIALNYELTEHEIKLIIGLLNDKIKYTNSMISFLIKEDLYNSFSKKYWETKLKKFITIKSKLERGENNRTNG